MTHTGSVAYDLGLQFAQKRNDALSFRPTWSSLDLDAKARTESTLARIAELKEELSQTSEASFDAVRAVQGAARTLDRYVVRQASNGLFTSGSNTFANCCGDLRGRYNAYSHSFVLICLNKERSHGLESCP